MKKKFKYSQIRFTLGLRFALASLALISLDAKAQETYPGTKNNLGLAEQGVVVTGECLTKVAADRGSVTVGSTVIAPTSKEASEKAIKNHESLKSQIKSLKLADFSSETAEYSVQQECSYREGKRSCQGYRARLATNFETSDIARIGDIIALSSTAGAEEVSGLNLFASPISIKAARESCLESAMRDASAKAQRIANGANIKLGKLISVSEARSYDYRDPIPQGRQLAAAAMSEGLTSPPSVDSKPFDLRVELSARYAIE